jgi:SAM-dependent methyltransferase
MASMCEQNQDKIWRHFQGEGRDSFASSRPRLRYLAKRTHQWLGKRHGRVLNIGVGDGFFESQVIAAGHEVYSIDPDPEAIAIVSENGAKGFVGTIANMPFESQSFDVAAASEVLEHLSTSQRASGLAEIARVLRPGGLLIGTVPYNEDLKLGETVCPCCGAIFHRWGHQASFTLDSMRTELQAHFDVSEIRRTAFVSYADRGIGGKVKSALRVALAKLGQPIASPNILFLAKRK